MWHFGILSIFTAEKHMKTMFDFIKLVYYSSSLEYEFSYKVE